jgi:hypothetical protein
MTAAQAAGAASHTPDGFSTAVRVGRNRMLEPCDAKVSSTVLRGLGDRKVAWLLGNGKRRLLGALCRGSVRLRPAINDTNILLRCDL